MQPNFIMPMSNLQEIIRLKDTIVHDMKVFEKYVVFKVASASEFCYCPDCSFPTINVHEYKTYTVRDLPVFGLRCYLKIRKKRYKCDICGKIFTEELAFIEYGYTYTARYAEYIYKLTKGNTAKYVSDLEGIGYRKVEGIFYRKTEEKIKQSPRPYYRIICIDEISVRKGHKDFKLILYSPEWGHVIDVLENREKETLEKWLRNCPFKHEIQYVVTDMWKPYKSAVDSILPKVEYIVDRFHVMKNLNECLQKSRRQIQNKLSAEDKEKLKGSRWCLLKNQKELNEKETILLQQVYDTCEELGKCHSFKERFRAFFEMKNKDQAKEVLEKWVEDVKASGIKAFESFLVTIENWKENILAYFRERMTNGYAEGMNNKIKMVKRRGFGYTNFRNFRLRILATFM